MTHQTPSRATLADVLRAIEQDQNLAVRRKQEFRSAVRLVAKVIGQSPDQIAADPRGLRLRLKGTSHLSLGLSAGRWANCKSLLRAALRLIGPSMPGASKIELRQEWLPLADEAKKLGSCWLRLCRLVGWLSEEGITPLTLTRQHIDAFRDSLFDDALLGHPERSWSATRRSWERMRLACGDWPQIILEKAPNRMVYSLAWCDFPPGLKLEVDRLLQHLGGEDFGDEAGPVRPLRPTTLKARAHEVRAFASALVHKGVPVETLTDLKTCLSLENFKLGLGWFYERHDKTRNASLHNMAAHLRGIARHWLQADASTIGSMTKIVRKLAPPQEGMSKNIRTRMLPLYDDETLRKVVNLPQVIRRHLETSKDSQMRRVGLSTASVAIEILVSTALRMENLRTLHLDRNLLKVGPATHIAIPGEQVKNGNDLQFELAPVTVAMIDWYITNHRKAPPENRYLFAGENLGPKIQNTLRSQIADAVKEFTGLKLVPHDFRRMVGSVSLRIEPGNFEIPRRVLGHKNIATTTAAYTPQEDIRQRQYYVDLMQTFRAEEQASSLKKGERK